MKTPLTEAIEELEDLLANWEKKANYANEHAYRALRRSDHEAFDVMHTEARTLKMVVEELRLIIQNKILG